MTINFIAKTIPLYINKCKKGRYILIRIILFLSHTYLTHEFASRTIGLLEFPILDPRITSSFRMLTLVVKES